MARNVVSAEELRALGWTPGEECSPAVKTRVLEALAGGGMDAVRSGAIKTMAAPAELSAEPPAWIAEFEARDQRTRDFLTGWLSAHVALCDWRWPARGAFEAALEHYLETGQLLMLER